MMDIQQCGDKYVLCQHTAEGLLYRARDRWTTDIGEALQFESMAIAMIYHEQNEPGQRRGFRPL